MKPSDDIYRRAFHASSIPMAISTIAEGRYLDINSAGARALGSIALVLPGLAVPTPV